MSPVAEATPRVHCWNYRLCCWPAPTGCGLPCDWTSTWVCVCASAFACVRVHPERFNIHKANMRIHCGFVPSSDIAPLTPGAPSPGTRHTHCNGARVSGSAGCTGVPTLLSPSPCVPAPCRGRGGNPGRGEFRTLNSRAAGPPAQGSASDILVPVEERTTPTWKRGQSGQRGGWPGRAGAQCLLARL